MIDINERSRCAECHLEEPLDVDVLHDGVLLCDSCASRCGLDCVEVRL